MAEFLLSTNILRDADSGFDYITTKNASDIYDRIVDGYRQGQRAFNIIGSYGTGKSTFLLALEQHLSGKGSHFTPLNGAFTQVNKFVFLKLVGESSSFKQNLALQLGLPEKSNSKAILESLEELRVMQGGKKACLVLMADEFGKYLEYAASHNPDEELYFVQELAERANGADSQWIFLSTVHQNLSAYSRELSASQRQEWEKVKGRLVELGFNEPVSQLLHFASSYLRAKLDVSTKLKKKITGLNTIVEESRLVNFEATSGLEPLDILSASILVQALQKYGQNERSLFSFLNAPDKSAITAQHQERPEEVYGVAHVFEYLVQNLSSELEDAHKNPHRAQWKSMLVAMERCETIFEDRYSDVRSILATIGLINVFGKEGGLLDEKVLGDYCKGAYGIDDATSMIKKLIDRKIIQFARYRNKLNFKDGTDLDVQEELARVAGRVQQSENLLERLDHHVQFPILQANRYYYEYGTPRFIEFQLRETFNTQVPVGEMDGRIQVFLNRNGLEKELIEAGKEYPTDLVLILKNSREIKEDIYELDRFEYLLEEFKDDRVAIRILQEEVLARQESLEKHIFERIYDNGAIWLYQGKVQKFAKPRNLNSFLSEMMETAYPMTPRYKSELIQRHQLTSPILTARKALLNDMLLSPFKEDLGYPKDKFPPQKSIYLTLLKETGLHSKDGFSKKPTEGRGLDHLWSMSQGFLDRCKHNKVSLQEFYHELTSGKYKLKNGFVEFWIPMFLIMHKESIALFHRESGYVPYLSSEVLDLIHKKPDNYLIRKYEVEGVELDRLRLLQDITQTETEDGTQSTLISIFRQFVLFHKSLPEYTKKTQKLSSSALALRTAIDKATDPRAALIEELPAALGIAHLDSSQETNEIFKDSLDNAIRELKDAYEGLLSRIERVIGEFYQVEAEDFEKYSASVRNQLKAVNTTVLPDRLLALFKRLNSPIPDRDSYLKSVADVVLGRSIQSIKDSEEDRMLHDLREALADLQDQIDLSETDGPAVLIRLSPKGKDTVEKVITHNSDLSREKKKATTLLEELKPEDRIALLSELLHNELNHG